MSITEIAQAAARAAQKKIRDEKERFAAVLVRMAALAPGEQPDPTDADLLAQYMVPGSLPAFLHHCDIAGAASPPSGGRTFLTEGDVEALIECVRERDRRVEDRREAAELVSKLESPAVLQVQLTELENRLAAEVRRLMQPKLALEAKLRASIVAHNRLAQTPSSVKSPVMWWPAHI